jgi:hypothetical protein
MNLKRQPDWNRQVKVGRGPTDAGAFHRAIDVARQLLAAGRWPDPDRTCIVVHNAYEVHRRLQFSGPGIYDPIHNVNVFPAARSLKAGRDFEIVPATAGRRRLPGQPSFELGQIVATPGALALGVDLAPFLVRHAAGDWGELDDFDRRQNDSSLREGYRLLSAYTVGETNRRIWVITEADRSATTILLPEEY